MSAKLSLSLYLSYILTKQRFHQSLILPAGDKESKPFKPKKGILSRMSVTSGGQKTNTPAAAEAVEDSSVRGKRSMLSRISGKPGEPKTALGSTEMKEGREGLPAKPRKNMLSRISAAIVESKPPPAEEARIDDTSMRGKKGMLNRMSVILGDNKAGGGGDARDEGGSVRGKRGMLNRTSVRSINPAPNGDLAPDESYAERKEGGSNGQKAYVIHIICLIIVVISLCFTQLL